MLVWILIWELVCSYVFLDQ